ncbi:MAG: tetratricopeptide repeat protein [Ignavibacteria bacterium]|nr:tetratricopeptide repeat protein [Ignavibacteria bacterium]
MPIKPRYSINSALISPAREFTDRIEHIENFSKIVSSGSKKEYSVFSYYGVGGIGKSALRKELGRILDNRFKNVVWSQIDFELSPFREPETALYHLRKNLKDKYKIDFTAFDIAYTVYWQKTHPQLKLTKENIPFLDEGSLLSSLLSSASGIPLVGLLPSLAKSAFKGHKQLKNWWIKRGQRELFNLPSLSPKEILEKLPMYFSFDLKDFLVRKSLKAFFFADTFEALWENRRSEGAFFERDAWLRELIAQLPGSVWLIFGREKLRWNELDPDWDNFIEQFQLAGFSERDSAAFLNSCGIKDKKIQNIIISSSKGVPYYLDLSIDTFFQIKEIHNKEPDIKDFAGNQQEVLARFLKYLNVSEIETLRVLSVTRYWDSETFRILIKEFKTGYPLTAMNVLSRFSFIEFDSVTNTYRLHDLIRQGLLNLIDSEIRKSVNSILFENFNKKIPLLSKEISDEHCAFLNEAFFHAKQFMKFNELVAWFYNLTPAFNEAARWKTLKPVYEDLLNLSKVSGDPGEFATLIIYYSSVLYNLGEYKQALDLLESNMNDLEKILNDNDPRYASLLNNLATIYYYRGEMRRSKEIYEKVIDLRRKILGENHPHFADAIDNLAVIYNNTGEYDKAVELHKKAADIYKNTLGESHVHYADALNNLASGYLSLKKYEEAVELYIKSKEIVHNAVGREHPRYASSLHNLAYAYLMKKDYELALENNKPAYELRCKLLGENHPSTAVSLSNLAQIYQCIGNYDKSFQMNSIAAEIFLNTVGQQHFNYADSLFSLGELYLKKNEKTKAAELFGKSLDIYTALFGKEHKRVIDMRNQIKALG